MTRKSKIVNKAMKKSIEEKLLLINTIKGKLLSDEKQNELNEIDIDYINCIREIFN